MCSTVAQRARGKNAQTRCVHSNMTPLVHRPFWGRALAAGLVTVCAGVVVVLSLRSHSPALREPEPPAPRSGISLELTSTDDACVYYSRFDDPVATLAPTSKLERYTTPFDFMDGCHWESHETLTQVSPGRYAYTYTEAPVSCAPQRVAASACTRKGFVVVR